MIDTDTVRWRTQTDSARLEMGAAFSAMSYTGPHAARHADHADRYLPALHEAGRHLATALDGLAAEGEPANLTLAVLLRGANAHLRRSATLAEQADEHLDEEHLATEFVTGTELWCRMLDEMLVLTGDAPLGDDV